MADGKQYSMTEYLSPGSYFIRVRADGYFTQKTYGLTVISKSAQSAGSGSNVTGPAKCQIRSAKNSAKKTIKVKWKKNGADFYEVQIANNKAFTKKLQSYQTKKGSVVIKKRKKKKTYYIRLRAIKDGKVSEWSKVKKVKVKK